MKIGDYKQMMAYLTRPEQSKEQVADLVDELTPGPLKDELTKDYDPSQESYEEYLQRKALGERPFNAQDGGRANLAIGGGAIEGEDLGTREGFGSPEAIEYLKSLKPGSAVNTYAVGKQFNVDASTVAGQVQRNFPELRLQTKKESAAKAAETRRELYKQKLSDFPVVETKIRGSGKEARGKGRDITGIRFPNEEMKNDYIQDLTNRYSGVRGRKGLTNKELAEKYLGSSNPNDIGRIERINNYFVKNLNLEYEKAPISEVKEKRTRRLAITQGGRSFKGTEDIPFHHIMPIGGEVDLTTKDVAFINKQMNSTLAPYNTKLNDIADAISNQLNNQEPGYLKRIDELNNQAEQIIESVKTRLPKKYQNYIGFNRLDPILDENATPIRLNVTRVGVDDTKSLAGKIGEPVKLEGLTQKNINEIKKLKYRNAIKNFPISTGGPTLGAVGDIGMARDILSRDIETGKRLISEYGPKVLQGARQVTKLAVIPELAFGAAFAPLDLGEGRSGLETLLNVATLGMGVPISDARDRANYVDQFGLKEDLFSAQIKQSGAQYGAPELTEREQLALQKAEEFDTQILQPRLKKTLLERQAASDPNFGTGIMGMANGGRIGFRGGGMDMGAGSSKSSKSSGPAGGASSGGNYGGNKNSGPDRSKVSEQQERNNQAAVREAQAVNQKKEETINRIKEAQAKQSPIRTFFDHTNFTKTLKRVGSIPNYHQLGGYDFMSRFPNTPPSIAKSLGYGYQGLSEGIRSLNPFDNYSFQDAMTRAGEEGRLNALGVDAYGNPTNPITQQYYNLPTTLRPNFAKDSNNFKSDPYDNREQYGAQGQYSRPPSTPSDGNNFKSDLYDNREQYGAQGQYQRPPSTPSDGGDNKINLINTLNKFRPDTFVNPYNFSVDLNKNIGPFGLNSFINTLGILGIDDPRTPEDESEQDDYGISASYIRDLLGGTLGLGAGYSPTTGTNFGLNFSKQFNQGGRVGFADGPKNPGKRKTMKILAGLASLPILGRFFDVAQVAEKAAPAVVETFKNAPPHFIGLVNKIRALGRIIDPKKLLRYDKEKISNVYDYGDYRMFEGIDGQIKIEKEKFMGTDYGDAKVSEEYMSYNPKTPKFNKKGEKIPDEYEEVYEEYTAYPDSEGKMKDIYESVEPSTIDEGTYSKEELEQLIVEQIENNLKKGKEVINSKD
jgi:hypothetical protein